LRGIINVLRLKVLPGLLENRGHLGLLLCVSKFSLRDPVIFYQRGNFLFFVAVLLAKFRLLWRFLGQWIISIAVSCVAKELQPGGRLEIEFYWRPVDFVSDLGWRKDLSRSVETAFDGGEASHCRETGFNLVPSCSDDGLLLHTLSDDVLDLQAGFCNLAVLVERWVRRRGKAPFSLRVIEVFGCEGLLTVRLGREHAV